MSIGTARSGLDILVSGVGIAGPVVAYWLLQGNPDHRITLVERDTQLRTTGQSIDIRQAAVEVLKRMHLLEAVRGKTTQEAGIQFVNGQGKPFATIPTTGDDDQQSFSSEFEILRGDLVALLYDTVKDRVETVFGQRVETYEEKDGKVHVEYAKGRQGEAFDLLIAADGIGSKIRNIALGTLDDSRQHYRSFNNYAAYFTLCDPDLAIGQGGMAKWYNTSLGRAIFLRPDTAPGQ